MSAITSGLPQGPQLGGGPAALNTSDVNSAGIPMNPPGAFDPVQTTQQPQAFANTAIDTGGVTAPTPGGKGGFAPGAQMGGGPAPVVDPNAVNPLGPQGQQSTMPQQNIGGGGGKSSGGKGGFNPSGNQGISQEQLQSFARSILNQ